MQKEITGLPDFNEYQINFIMGAAKNYREQMKLCPTPLDATEQMLNILDSINEEGLEKIKLEGGRPISCTKGCAHCCHIQVSATANEAKLVAQYCRDNNISINKDTLREQAKVEDSFSYMFSPHKRCVFLGEDNLCKIYPVRPANCRNYFVVTPPEDCDTDGPNKGGKVASHYDINTTPVMLALIKQSKPGNFSQLLLNEIENGNEKTQ